MSTFHAVVWMDHQEAHVLMFDREHVESQRVKSRSHHKHQGKQNDTAQLYADIASLGRSAAPGGGPDKPKLPYTSGASGTGKSSRGIEDEEDVIYKIREAVRAAEVKGVTLSAVALPAAWVRT